MESWYTHLFLWKRALRKHAKSPSPIIIPLSGPEVYKRNYYSFSLENSVTNDYHFVLSHDERNIYTKRYIENAPSEDDAIPFETLHNFRFRAKYYKRMHEFEFDSLIKFVVWTGLKIPDIQQGLTEVDQWFYDRKSLATHDRYKILAYLVENATERPNSNFSVLSVMAKLFEQRVVLHPDFQNRKAYYQLIFSSLESENLIERVDYQYRLSPKAITALHHYEEEKRRHNAGAKIQRTLAWLTGIAAVSAVAQALIAWFKN